MNKILTVLIALGLLTGCEQQNDLRLNAGSISSIDVFKFNKKGQNRVKQIIDRQVINQIVNCLNHASKEPNKFYPTYKLIFHSRTGEISATIHGHAIYINTTGRYMTSCDIEQLIQ